MVDGNAMRLQSMEPFAQEYQWIDCQNNFEIPGATNPFYVSAVDGEFKVRITKGECVQETSCYALGFGSLQDMNLGSFQLYPNPIEKGGTFFIRSGGLGDIAVKVYTIHGSLIYCGKYDADKGISLSIKPGVYLYQLSDPNKSDCGKLIVR